MTQPISLPAYWQRLREHDWTYPYSDDHSVWERGAAEHQLLQFMRSQSRDHEALFIDFVDWAFDGEPMPPQPTEKAA